MSTGFVCFTYIMEFKSISVWYLYTTTLLLMQTSTIFILFPLPTLLSILPIISLVMLWSQTIPKLQWLKPASIHFMLLLHASYKILRDSAAYSHLGVQSGWDYLIEIVSGKFSLLHCCGAGCEGLVTCPWGFLLTKPTSDMAWLHSTPRYMKNGIFGFNYYLCHTSYYQLSIFHSDLYVQVISQIISFLCLKNSDVPCAHKIKPISFVTAYQIQRICGAIF